VEADPHVSLWSKQVSGAEYSAFIDDRRQVAGDAQEQKARQRHVARCAAGGAVDKGIAALVRLVVDDGDLAVIRLRGL